MAKYKRCPGCGKHVSPTEIECPDCEADLISIPVTDEEDHPAPAAQTPGRMIRRCDCGAENPPQARKCMACKEDISDILPTPLGAKEACAEAELVSLDGLWKTAIGADPMILGREQHGRDYLRSRSYVSRSHARLVLEEGEVRITSLSRSNPTFINNVPMQTDETRTLQCGDEIGLGGCVIGTSRQDEAAYFILKM